MLKWPGGEIIIIIALKGAIRDFLQSANCLVNRLPTRMLKWPGGEIIIIALKGAIRDFLQSPHCLANRLQQVRSSGLSAITCNT